jgi:hypothetical protein
VLSAAVIGPKAAIAKLQSLQGYVRYAEKLYAFASEPMLQRFIQAPKQASLRTTVGTILHNFALASVPAGGDTSVRTDSAH